MNEELRCQEEHLGGIIQDLHEENKRYREAIKGAIREFNQDEHQYGMSLLLKALEESK